MQWQSENKEKQNFLQKTNFETFNNMFHLNLKQFSIGLGKG